MKNILSVVIILLSNFVISQNYNFKPQWKKGDVKTISISQSEKEYENDVLISDTIIYNEAKITVIKIQKEFYTLEVLFENQALRSAIEFYDKLGEELEEYQDLKLIFTVNKETAKTELQNWEETIEFMNNSFEQITSVIENKAPEVAPYISMMFRPLKQVFNSKENIEAYMMSFISYLFTPFNHEFKIGETITSFDTEDNPLNPMQQVSATTLLTLEQVDEKSNNCIIKNEVVLDLSDFKEMMKDMMLKMASSFEENDSIAKNKAKEFGEFQMDMKNVQTITFNKQTTWVTKTVANSTFLMTDPQTGIGKKAETVITTIVR